MDGRNGCRGRGDGRLLRESDGEARTLTLTLSLALVLSLQRDARREELRQLERPPDAPFAALASESRRRAAADARLGVRLSDRLGVSVGAARSTPPRQSPRYQEPERTAPSREKLERPVEKLERAVGEREASYSLSRPNSDRALPASPTPSAFSKSSALITPRSARIARNEEGRSLRELQRELESLKSSLSVYLGNGLS
mmetsp:Transcript_72507/g.144001  ORF Transcript_72507/g.144001 Transcript_72507/m.144001 type:complete len:199 (-) Transcript_72507:463-1059(-)